MAAAATDKFRKLSRRWVGQIGAGGVADASVTTIPLSSATNLPTDTGVTVVINRVDANGVSTPASEETVVGVVSGNSLVNCVRGVEGTAQAHDAGSVVEVLVTADGYNDIVDGILSEHTQAGAHAAITATSVTSTGVVTGSHLDLAASGALRDANDNELIKFTQTASAVNEFTVGNAITGSSVTLNMTGGDTNIGFDLRMKGSGKYRKPTVIDLVAFSPATDTSTGDGKIGFRVPAELSGMNLTGVAACVTTAGTTNTTDVQIRRVRAGSSVDMLSTKITIDSTEVDTSTAAAAAVIDTSNDDVTTGDQIYVDVDAVSTTAAKGLIVELRFELP